MTSQPATELRVRLARRLLGIGAIRSAAVYDAFLHVSRETFVPSVPLEDAFADRVIPLLQRNGELVSSSSQPAMVAEMLEQLRLRPGMKVLEIGTGSGYNAALIASIVGPHGSVVTVELEEMLSRDAAEHLRTAGANNVSVVHANGISGYAPAAPYDRIIVTVCANDIAAAWWDQLREGGRLVMPLSLHGFQKSIEFVRWGDRMQSVSTIDCGFVALRNGTRNDAPLALTDERDVVFFGPTASREQIVGLLRTKPRRIDTGLRASAYELYGGLAFWVAATQTGSCRLEMSREYNAIPATVRWPEHRFAVGLLRAQTLALIDVQPGFWPDIYQVSVVEYGAASEAARQLCAAIAEWDRSGKPNSSALTVTATRRLGSSTRLQLSWAAR